jgi:pSer/pThr/pTyr-binding forkhead associated (FHA) protein
VPEIGVAAPEDTPGLPGSLRLAVSGAGDQQPAIYVIDAPFALVGRAKACGLQLDHPAVSRRHTYLQVIHGRVYGVNVTNSGETQWSDGPRKADWIGPDEAIGIGPYKVRLADPGPPDGHDGGSPLIGFSPLDRYTGQFGPVPKVEIEFLTGATNGTKSAVTRLITLAGSSARCKFRFEDRSVSSVHFSFVLTPDGLWVVDLAGRNGVAINRRPVRLAKLRDRDKLLAGAFLMRLHYTGDFLGATSAAAPPQLVVTPPEAEASPPRLSPGPDVATDSARVDEPQRELEALGRQLAAESDRLEQEKASLAQSRREVEASRTEAKLTGQAEIEKLLDQARQELASASVQRDELEARKAALDHEQQAVASAREQMAEIAQARERLEAESHHIQEERRRLGQQRSGRVADAVAWESQQSAFQSDRAQFETERIDFRRRDEALRADEREFASQREALAAERARLADLQTAGAKRSRSVRSGSERTRSQTCRTYQIGD